jgi:UDP-2,4-diacetamido-2,4,6-trideoxy-beta-L-altropyranose hydrolase
MIKSVTKIVFRADGNSEIGLGHIVRSLALAAMLKEYFATVFVTKNDSVFIRDQVAELCSEHRVIVDDEDFFSQLNSNEMVVLDGYHFDSTYQQRIKNLVHKLIVIDDEALIDFHADLIINQGGELLREKYRTEIYTKLLTGFGYLLVREPFLKASRKKRHITKVDSVFVCMGGADPCNITAKVLQACINTAFVKKVFVVSGTAYQNRKQLLEMINNSCIQKDIVHMENIDATQMVRLISEAEIAVCPSSSVSLEACSVKVGLLTGTYVDNQKKIHQQLINSDCCISLGDFNLASIEQLQMYLHHLNDTRLVNNMIETQSKIFDGLSASRIVMEFKLLAAC